MDKVNLMGYDVADMENLMLSLGENKFKGRQLFKWLYKLQENDFLQMTELTKDLREKITQDFSFIGPRIVKIARSRDGTEKLLFELGDQEYIEAVLIPDPESEKQTVCLSSQVGCPLKCKFCATGLAGYKRNLSAGEIIGQLWAIRKKYGPEAFRNIVFMGMGEPFLNYANVVKSIGIISTGSGLSLSARHVTISTVGLPDQIYQLADSKLKINLAVSLHASTDEQRAKIIPISKKYHLREVMNACRYYTDRTKKRVTFEYILFKGFNDTRRDALKLADLVRGIPCKINILAYNPVENLPYQRPTDEEINEFGKILYPLTPAVTVRKSRGLDIDAACGQLAGKYKKGKLEEKVT